VGGCIIHNGTYLTLPQTLTITLTLLTLTVAVSPTIARFHDVLVWFRRAAVLKMGKIATPINENRTQNFVPIDNNGK